MRWSCIRVCDRTRKPPGRQSTGCVPTARTGRLGTNRRNRPSCAGRRSSTSGRNTSRRQSRPGRTDGHPPAVGPSRAGRSTPLAGPQSRFSANASRGSDRRTTGRRTGPPASYCPRSFAGRHRACSARCPGPGRPKRLRPAVSPWRRPDAESECRRLGRCCGRRCSTQSPGRPRFLAPAPRRAGARRIRVAPKPSGVDPAGPRGTAMPTRRPALAARRRNRLPTRTPAIRSSTSAACPSGRRSCRSSAAGRCLRPGRGRCASRDKRQTAGQRHSPAGSIGRPGESPSCRPHPSTLPARRCCGPDRAGTSASRPVRPLVPATDRKPGRAPISLPPPDPPAKA